MAIRFTLYFPKEVRSNDFRPRHRSTLAIEQKRIFLNLRENSRGRYLRIAEVSGLALSERM